MGITREKKEELVTDLSDVLKSAQVVILTDYRGLPTADLAGLRNQLRGMKASYRVTKNTLVILALRNAGLPVPEKLLDGPTALAFLQADIAGPAKLINSFFREKGIPVKGAIVGQSIYDAKGVEDLANLPGREQLHAGIVGSLQGPASSLVGVLNGALSDLIRTLQAKADRSEAAVAATPAA